MKIRRLQRWISEQLFGRPLVLATGALLTVSYGSSVEAQTTATFQQGVAGYTGVLDTWIRSLTPPAAGGTTTTLTIDGGNTALGDTSWSQGLFQFGNIFGTGPGQIPVGSNILTATMTVRTGTASNDQSSNNFNIFRLTTGFTSATTWATGFGGDGVTVGVDTIATRDDRQSAGGLLTPNTGTIVGFNVINSLQTWAGLATNTDANNANLGWVITTDAGTDGWVIASSENATVANRPLLTVQYAPGGGQGLTWNALNATGTWNTTTGNTPWLNIANANSKFSNGDTANFSQNPTSPVTVTVDATGVTPVLTNFTHTTGKYTFTGGAISGNFAKSGAGDVVLAATNDFAAASISAGTVETSANNPFGTLDTLTISNNAVWKATAASQSSVKGFAIGSGGATLNVDSTNSLVISGATSGTDLLTKTGTGSVTFAGTSSFTGTLNIDAGTVIVSDPVSVGGAQGDLNASVINVASGAKFQFGSITPITGENPDLPANTAINLPTGAVADWYVGESFGSVNLTGGTLNNITGGVNVGDAAGSTFTSGTIISPAATQAFTLPAASSINKNTAGTVTVTNTDFSAAGGIFINEGTISTNGALTGAGLISLGTASTVGTLQLRITGTLTVSKLTSLGTAGGIIDVSQATGNVLWTGNVVAGGALTKIGPGTLRLSGTGSYTGPTNVNDGTLATNSTGLSTSTIVNVANGKSLWLTDSAATASIAGLNLGSTGAANLQFSINGNTTLAPLSVTGTDAFIATAGSNVILQSSVPLTVGSFPLMAYSGTIGGGGSAGLNLVLPPHASGTLLNTGTQLNVNITSSDTLKWTGANSAAWDINSTPNWNLVTGGTAASYLENPLSGDFVAFDDSATGSTAITLSADVKPALMAFNNTSKNYSISGTGKLSGVGQLTKAGTGTLTLDVQHTSTGAITVNDGTLTVNSANTFAGNLILNNGTLNLTAANTLPSLAVNNGTASLTAVQTVGALTVAGGTVTSTVGSTFGTITQSNGSVTLGGTNSIGSATISGGSAVWSGSNTVGGITLSGGSLETQANNGIGSTGTITITNNALLRATTASQSTGKALTVNTGGATIQVDPTIDYTIGGTTAGTGTVTKTGAGTLILTGGTSYTGTLDIQAGKVVLQDVGGGDLNSTSILVNSGTTFQFGGVIGSTENPDLPSTTYITIKSGGTSEFRIAEDFGGLNIEGGTLLLSGGGANIADTVTTNTSSFLSGTITSTGAVRAIGGARAIIKSTPGVVTVTDTTLNNTGGISILDGTISTNAGFNTTGALTLGDTSTLGTLQLRTAAAQTIAKPVTLNAGGGKIDVSTATGVVTWSGVISSGGNLEKSGPGALILSGANTYTGTTTVSAGKLLINGNSLTATGNVNVAAGATLGGTGTVGGPANFASTAILAPGVNAGNLTLGKGANLSAGGIFQWQLGALSTATNFDSIAVSAGNLTLGGTSALTLDFSLIAATDPNSTDTFWNTAQSWKIVDITGTATNVGNASLAAITNATYTRGVFTTTVGTASDAGDIFLVFTPVISGPPTWQGANNDAWTATGSWAGVVPNSATAEAKFVSTGGTTANLDADQTVNKLTFDSTADHTVSGPGKLTVTGTTPSISTAATNTGTQTVAVNLDLAAGTTVTVNAGTLNLNAPTNATLGSGVTATVATGATLNLGGAGNALSNGTTTHANVTNNGTLAATTAGKRVGNVTGTGTTTVTDAGASLTASSIRQSGLAIGAGNTVTVAPNGNNSGVSKITTLSINATGKLDLKDNDLIVSSGSLTTAQVRTMVASGLGGNGILSSTNVALRGLGTASILETSYANTGSYGGLSVTNADTLVKYTYKGDADLNGVIDIDDYDRIDSGFLGGGNRWAQGDFDYNGVIDIDDYDLIDSAFLGQSGPALGPSFGSPAFGIEAIPEPSTWVLGGISLLGLLGCKLRSRRRNSN